MSNHDTPTSTTFYPFNMHVDGMGNDHVYWVDNPSIVMPPIGSVWRNAKGAIRIVSDVDEVWVHYRRPAPAEQGALTVTGGAWAFWVEQTQARRLA